VCCGRLSPFSGNLSRSIYRHGSLLHSCLWVAHFLVRVPSPRYSRPVSFLTGLVLQGSTTAQSIPPLLSLNDRHRGPPLSSADSAEKDSIILSPRPFSFLTLYFLPLCRSSSGLCRAELFSLVPQNPPFFFFSVRSPFRSIFVL